MARPEFDALSGYRPTVRVTGTPSNKARHKTLQNTRRIIKRLNSIDCIGERPASSLFAVTSPYGRPKRCWLLQ